MKQISSDSRDLLNGYLCDEMKVNLRASSLLRNARQSRQTNERVTIEGHTLIVDLRKHLDSIDELLTQEKAVDSSGQWTG